MPTPHLRARAVALAAAALAGSALLGACNDKQFLTEVPYDFVGPENFYRTQGDAIAAINGVYGSLINTSGDSYYGRNFVMLVELPAEAVTTYLSATNERSLVDNYTFTPSHSYIYSSWQAAYATINRANSVIGRVPAIPMDTTLRSRIVAEAKFLRALNHFNLVRLFGDVPLRTTETTSLDSLKGPRTPAADVYAQIVTDLQQAAAVLPARYAGTDIGRATKGAAQTLLVKAYLQRAATIPATAAADRQAALTLAREIAGSGTYSLVPAPATLWDFVGDPAAGVAGSVAENNSEVIFDIQNTRQQGLGGRIGNHFTPRNSSWEASQNGSFEAESTFFASYATTDRRRQATFVLSFPNRAGALVSYTPTATASGTYGADTPYLKKFIDPQLVSAGQEEPNYIILRFADLLLMQAEAANEVANGPTTEAYTAVNAVRARAGLPALATGLSYQAFKDAVFEERRKELVGEGPNAYFDSQRNWEWAKARIEANMARGRANSFRNSRFPKAQVTLDDHFRVMPVPQRAIDLNAQLKQNTGY